MALFTITIVVLREYWPTVDNRDTVLSGVTSNFVDCASPFAFYGNVFIEMASLWYKVIFICISIHRLVAGFKKMQKVRTLLVRMRSECMAEPRKQYSLEVFDNFSKVYASDECSALRRINVDPDKLFCMSHKRNLVFKINDIVYQLPVTYLKMAANPSKFTGIRR